MEMQNEDIDFEVLRQANELLRLLKSQRIQGKVPTPESVVTIKVSNISYRLRATEDTLKTFIKKYKKKECTPRTRKLPMKSLPKFNKKNFNAWELCETEDQQTAETLGDLF